MLRQLTCHLEKEIKLDCYLMPDTNIIQMEQRFQCNDEAIKILGEKINKKKILGDYVGHSQRVGRSF